MFVNSCIQKSASTQCFFVIIIKFIMFLEKKRKSFIRIKKLNKMIDNIYKNGFSYLFLIFYKLNEH
jgi:hypothetical protein